MIMESFVYEALPTRVMFGSGTIDRIREEVERLGARRALVLSTPGRGEDLANKVSSLLRDRSAGVHGAVMHTPIDATEKALSVVRERAAYPNPRPLDGSAIRELIVRAWTGKPP